MRKKKIDFHILWYSRVRLKKKKIGTFFSFAPKHVKVKAINCISKDLIDFDKITSLINSTNSLPFKEYK